MSRYDIVIFGATGFTGKRAVEELARGGGDYVGLTWAVAGRNPAKLQELLAEVCKKTGADITKVGIITADVGDPPSLNAMCAQARVVANYCGPYQHFGEPVVRAAIQNGAHHLDVSGEPLFIESMQLKYDAEARDAGVFVISACGFDSVPNDMGVVFLEQKFQGTLNSVESFLNIAVSPQYEHLAKEKGILNTGTWESFVYAVVHQKELAEVRKQLFKEPMPVIKPVVKQRVIPHKRLDRWILPFPGADDAVVDRTTRSRGRPLQFISYGAAISFSTILKLVLMATMVFVFSTLKCTRNWLLKFPRFFSRGLVAKDGPPQEVIENTKFTVDLIGTGWEHGENVDAVPPKKVLHARVSGMNPAYSFTAMALLQAAVSIILEREKMPTSGVVTTGTAFANTSFIKRLQGNNVEFAIVDSEKNEKETQLTFVN